jgi:hypothetical protein
LSEKERPSRIYDHAPTHPIGTVHRAPIVTGGLPAGSFLRQFMDLLVFFRFMLLDLNFFHFGGAKPFKLSSGLFEIWSELNVCSHVFNAQKAQQLELRQKSSIG